MIRENWKFNDYNHDHNILRFDRLISLQVCAGQEAGAEAKIHAVHGIFKDHTTEVVLLIDAENAFNAINRICLLFQHKDLERVKEELTNNFSNICDWFVDNKLSIYFGEDKTKSILFSTKNRKWKIGTFDIQHGDVKIKQYSKVTYLGCELDESLSGEVMALKVIIKINGRLKFLYRKNRYLTPYLNDSCVML